MADPVSLLQSEGIRQALRDGQVDKYSAIADKWRSYTYSARVESGPAAATSVTTPLPSRTSPSASRIHDKMAVATAPSIGFFLPTPQPVPSTIAIPGPAGVGIPSSSSPPHSAQSTKTGHANGRPTEMATVLRPVSTGANQFLTTSKPVPRYSGAGNLLTSSCTVAKHTLVDAGSSVYYVPFIGCINKKPDCCPFIPRPTGSAIYPQPINQEDAVLDHCPADYHSVAGGGCCPSGYSRWTSLLGGQTPCFSPVQARRTPQATTTHPGRGVSATGKPTVVIADAVFSMQYTTEQSPGGLSGGAIAGIVIGVIAGVVLLSAGLAYVFIRRRRAMMNPGMDLKSENGGCSSYRGTPAPPEIAHSNMSTSNTQTISRGTGTGTGQGFEAPPSYEAPSAEMLRDQEPLRIHVGRSISWEEDLSQKPRRGDEDDLDEGYSFESEASSPVQENTGILEVQLARPQRLSRGYARIVYTQSPGSVSSIHTDGKSIRSNLMEPR